MAVKTLELMLIKHDKHSIRWLNLNRFIIDDMPTNDPFDRFVLIPIPYAFGLFGEFSDHYKRITEHAARFTINHIYDGDTALFTIYLLHRVNGENILDDIDTLRRHIPYIYQQHYNLLSPQMENVQ